jgi:hypothetical protein
VGFDRRAALCGCAITGSLAFAACSSTTPKLTELVCRAAGSHFELDLISSTGGRPTPVAAAEWDASHHVVPGFALPTSGWYVVHRGPASASVRSGSYQVQAVQGPDGTWQVDSGYDCRRR